jgi:hypothetical protein
MDGIAHAVGIIAHSLIHSRAALPFADGTKQQALHSDAAAEPLSYRDDDRESFVETAQHTRLAQAAHLLTATGLMIPLRKERICFVVTLLPSRSSRRVGPALP